MRFTPGIFLSVESQGRESTGDFMAVWLAMLSTTHLPGRYLKQLHQGSKSIGNLLCSSCLD